MANRRTAALAFSLLAASTTYAQTKDVVAKELKATKGVTDIRPVAVLRPSKIINANTGAIIGTNSGTSNHCKYGNFWLSVVMVNLKHEKQPVVTNLHLRVYSKDPAEAERRALQAAVKESGKTIQELQKIINTNPEASRAFYSSVSNELKSTVVFSYRKQYQDGVPIGKPLSPSYIPLNLTKEQIKERKDHPKAMLDLFGRIEKSKGLIKPKLSREITL